MGFPVTAPFVMAAPACSRRAKAVCPYKHPRTFSPRGHCRRGLDFAHRLSALTWVGRPSTISSYQISLGSTQTG